MRPAAACMTALFLSLVSVTAANGGGDGILVSGQPFLAIVDGDMNGPDLTKDCRFIASAGPANALMIMSVQAMAPQTPLRACSGQYLGYFDPGFPTDTSIFGMITSSTIIGGIGFPLSFDGTFLPPSDSAPRRLSRLELTNAEAVGSGFICNSNGAAAQVKLANGVTMVVGLGMETPGYLRVPGVPFQKADLSGKLFLDVFIPKTDGTVTFALQSDPTHPFIDVPLSGELCLGRTAAPTLSEWKLIVLALALTVVGSWMIARRPAFYEALPVP